MPLPLVVLDDEGCTCQGDIFHLPARQHIGQAVVEAHNPSLTSFGGAGDDAVGGEEVEEGKYNIPVWVRVVGSARADVGP